MGESAVGYLWASNEATTSICSRRDRYESRWLCSARRTRPI